MIVFLSLFFSQGIGSRLHVYRIQPIVQLVGTHSILPGRVIHGIKQGKVFVLFVYFVAQHPCKGILSCGKVSHVLKRLLNKSGMHPADNIPHIE